MRSFPLYIVVVLLAFSSCGKEEALTFEKPDTYTFERSSSSSVDFNGQTTRIRMAEELSSALLNPQNTGESLLSMYDNSGNNAFNDPALNASSKSIKSKVAASRDYFSGNSVLSFEIKAELENWLNLQASEVFPSWNQMASPGVAGQLADGASVRYVSADGLEYNQAFAKSLIGALMLDQMLNNYLSPAVLDEGNNRVDNDNALVLEGTNHTTMEHKWDEAFGYLFGNTPDVSQALLTLGQDDSFLNKYLARVEGDPDFEGIAFDVYDAFIAGRTAIVNSDYDSRDEYADIIKEKMSEVIAVRAVHYLEQAYFLLEVESTSMGTIFHDLSEAYGFIYSLQFTQNPATGQAYFSSSEVSSFLDELMNDGPNGLWDVQAETVSGLASTIASRFGFTVEQAADR